MDLKWISWRINFCALNIILLILDTKSTGKLYEIFYISLTEVKSDDTSIMSDIT